MPLDNRTDRAQPSNTIGHNTQQYRRRWQRDLSRSRLQSEEREMWTTLFSLTLAAAVCSGVAAVVMTRNQYLAKYLARMSG